MNVSSLLRPEYVALDLKARARLDALHELTQLVRSHPDVKDFASFCRSVHEREAMGSTALSGHEIAIPHARTDQVTDIVLAAGRSPQGVFFEGKEPQTVKLIFLIGTPKRMVMEYLQLLGSLARLLKQEPFRASLLSARTTDEFVRVFQQEEMG